MARDPNRTAHGAITPEALSDIQPGMARLMAEYSQRFWVLYYAAKARNWPLAKHMLNEMRKLGKIIPVVRPKYGAAMEEFEATYLDPLDAGITAEDWPAFDAAYARAIDGSDEFHDRFGKAFIRFRLPPDPPPWFELEPGARPRRN